MARRSVGNRSFKLRPLEWTLSLSLGDVWGSLVCRVWAHVHSFIRCPATVTWDCLSQSVLFCLSVHLRSPASSYELFTFAFAFSSASAPNTHCLLARPCVVDCFGVSVHWKNCCALCALCSVFAYRLIRCVNCLKCAQLNCSVLLRVLSLSLYWSSTLPSTPNSASVLLLFLNYFVIANWTAQSAASFG